MSRQLEDESSVPPCPVVDGMLDRELVSRLVHSMVDPKDQSEMIRADVIEAPIRTRKITAVALERLRPLDPTEEKIRTRIEGSLMNWDTTFARQSLDVRPSMNKWRMLYSARTCVVSMTSNKSHPETTYITEKGPQAGEFLIN